MVHIVCVHKHVVSHTLNTFCRDMHTKHEIVSLYNVHIGRWWHPKSRALPMNEKQNETKKKMSGNLGQPTGDNEMAERMATQRRKIKIL